MPQIMFSRTHQPARAVDRWSFSITPRLTRVQKTKLSGRHTHSINKNSVKSWCSVSLSVGNSRRKGCFQLQAFFPSQPVILSTEQLSLESRSWETFSQLHQCCPSSSKNVIFRFARKAENCSSFYIHAAFNSPSTERRTLSSSVCALP